MWTVSVKAAQSELSGTRPADTNELVPYGRMDEGTPHGRHEQKYHHVTFLNLYINKVLEFCKTGF